MDIKDFILIGGGLLIAAVVAHGFWIAWRDRRQDLRIDIKPDLIPDEVDEIDRLRGELPNGGARLVPSDYEDPQQDLLELDEQPPLLLEPTEAPPRRIEPEMTSAAQSEAQPEAVEAAESHPADDFESIIARHEQEIQSRAESRRAVDDVPEPVPEPPAEASVEPAGRAKVAEVALPDPIVADEPKRPRRLAQRKPSERAATGRRSTSDDGGAGRQDGERRELTAAVPVEELFVMNVLSELDRPYTGDELFTTLRTCGLKFGDMNIFHRIEPLTKAVQYSVASAVEPGTFDMADMEAIRCPGLCLFMQLPGPEDPSAAFEDMLSVARSVTKSLGGEIKDEHRNVMTPQTVEHYRQRIVDFSRRRMSKRA